MKGFLKTLGTSMLGAALVVGAYHVSVGMSVLAAYKGMDGAQKLAEKTEHEIVLRWPAMLTATEVMSGRWVEVMDDIGRTLDELNSGRWRRVEELD